jgi:hypothetical protein
MNKSSSTFIVLTFFGMVGLYILLFVAYKKYQEKTQPGTVGGLLANLAGNP